MFKPAKKVQKKLKIAVYGDSGVGKTWFGLQAPGKKAVIDTENGTDFYGSEFEFDVLKSRLYSEVKKAVEHVEKSGKYDVLIIDPITNVYQTLKDAAQAAAERRARRRGQGGDDVSLTFRDWGIIKNRFNSIVSQLCNMNCHVIITGWMKDVYEGQGDNMKKVGTKIDADKKLEYQPDVIIRLEVDAKGNRFGVIEKDRTMTYKKGQRIKDISFNDFLEAANGDTGEAATKLISEDQAAELEADSFDPIESATIGAIKTAWIKAGQKVETLNAQAERLFGVGLEQMSESQGRDFLAKIEELKGGTKSEDQAG